jgi:hypothetical protein
VTTSYERGAILVESALVVSTALTLMLFTVDLGILGYFQTSADAASFFDAHENVIGMKSGTPEGYTSSLFPALKPGDMSPSVLPAPSPDVPVNYGYNATAGQTPDPDSANHRHGGASLMQPVQLQVSVSPSPFFDVGGARVGVSSNYAEPKWTECGPHYNVANENEACGASPAPPNSAVAYTDAEYTPPYYVGYNLVTHCEDPQPWGDVANGYEPVCLQTNFLALGVASYLDTDNWDAANPGVSGTYGSSVFQAAAFHQRVYAHIAQFFAVYPHLFGLYEDYEKSIAAELGIPHIGAPSTAAFQSFAGWSAFAASNDGNPAKADPQGIDEAIQCVYGWDETIASGYPPSTYQEPGQYPLFPEKPCPAGVTI